MFESTAANPTLLADQVSSLLVQPLEAASVVLSSGPRIFDTAGVLRIPKLTGSSSVGFVGENELIPSDHDTTFDEVVLMPTERKSIKVIERYSRELARQAVIGIDATLKNRLVKVVSDKLDTALLTGKGQVTNEVQTVTVAVGGNPFTLSYRGQETGSLANGAAASTVQTALQGLSTIGSGNATVAGSAGGPYTVTFGGTLAATSVDQLGAAGATVVTTSEGESANGITGLINQPGVQTGELDVTDADSLLDAIALASAAEVTPTRWFLSGADFIALRKLKDGNERYLIESDVTLDTTYRLFGIPVTVTNKLATGKGILADTSQIAIARDLAPSVTILSERYADYDQIGIRVVTRYDLGLLHPEAVIVLTAA